MASSATDIFEAERPRLENLAYRMLGERSAAEDVVQDAWLRWAGTEPQAVREPAAWLTTVTTRLAIDALTSARARREIYVGPWLPEPVIDSWPTNDGDPQRGLEQSQEVELALLWTMERLAPEERAAFILREAFDTDYGDIARTLDKSEAACRQLVSRAKRRVSEQAPRYEAPDGSIADLLNRFMSAALSQDRDQVLALLAPDATAISDGGGKARAAFRPLIGADEVAQVLLSLVAKNKFRTMPRLVRANGRPALAILGGGEDDLITTVTPTPDGTRIGWIYVMRNPDKLDRARTDAAAWD